MTPRRTWRSSCLPSGLHSPNDGRQEQIKRLDEALMSARHCGFVFWPAPFELCFVLVLVLVAGCASPIHKPLVGSVVRRSRSTKPPPSCRSGPSSTSSACTSRWPAPTTRRASVVSMVAHRMWTDVVDRGLAQSVSLDLVCGCPVHARPLSAYAWGHGIEGCGTTLKLVL